MYTVHTDKLAIEHTSVGLAHARPIIKNMYDITRSAVLLEGEIYIQYRSGGDTGL